MNVLTNEDAERLKEAGYTEWEVDQFSDAKTPEGKDQPQIDLNSQPWIKAIENRHKWKNQLISEGWTEEQFVKNIYEQYNRNPNQSPWDFLKTEYKPPQKPKFKSTIEATARVREFKHDVKINLRKTSRKLEGEEREFFDSTLGETIRRLNKEGR